MSYEIYYERAYIKVNDKFIPLVNSGSNNCWERSYFSKRDVPEKNWSILNYKRKNQIMFTADEIREIAKDYEEISGSSGTCFKSRHRPFAKGEFERWIINGMNTALSIEEYIHCGNTLRLLDYSRDMSEWKWYPFSTDEELFELLDELKDCKLLSVEFSDNRNVYKPKQPPKVSSVKKLDEYYVLKGYIWSDAYFCSIRKRAITYCRKPSDASVKAFATEAEANRYLTKYEDRLSKFNFHPERYCKSEVIA